MKSTPFCKFNTGKVYARLSDGDKLLLCDINISVQAGKSLAIVGETGSGKTMTALCMMALLPTNVFAKGAELMLCDDRISEPVALLGKEIVYIPQNGSEALGSTRKIKNIFADTLKRLGVPKEERAEICEKNLLCVGLSDTKGVLRAYPFQLSGGMAQRVCIALALCAEPKLVIADEPTNGLDEKSKNEFFALLKKSFPGAAIIIITHDFALAKCCDDILVIKDGKTEEQGSTTEVLSSPKNDYTKALIDCAFAAHRQK